MNILKVQLGELFDDNLPINETTEIVLRELIGDKKRTDHLIEHFTHPLQRVNGAIIMPSSTDNTKYDFGKLGKLNIRIHPQLLKKIDVENQWRDELAIHRNQVAMYQSLFAFSASQVNQIQTVKNQGHRDSIITFSEYCTILTDHNVFRLMNNAPEIAALVKTKEGAPMALRTQVLGNGKKGPKAKTWTRIMPIDTKKSYANTVWVAGLYF